MIMMRPVRRQRRFTIYRINVCAIASPYLAPYIRTRSGHLDTEYGMRKNKDGTFKVGNYSVQIDDNSDIHIGKKRFIFKNVNLETVTSDDLRMYKQIQELTCEHLEKYNPAVDLNLSRSNKFRYVITGL
jgi:hypothetical protein